MTAQVALQARIDAQQQLDAIVYAQRSIKLCGGTTYCVGVHAAQVIRGKVAAAEVLRGDREQWRAMDGWLGAAKDKAAAELKAAKAAVKDIGNVRQLRLALGTEGATHSFALAA